MNYLLYRRGTGGESCFAIASKAQCGMQVYSNDVSLPDAETVFRWGCTATAQGANDVNSIEAIHAVSNKREFRQKLQEAGLCPATWFIPDQVQFPCIVRPSMHAQGENLWICQDRHELEAAMAQCTEGWYASEIIQKTAEYRVYIVQNRVLLVHQKVPADPSQIAWNHAQGGEFQYVKWGKWPLHVVRTAMQAYALSGLDFGAVDVIVDELGVAFVLEINTAPSVTSAYDSGCFAKVFDHIAVNGKAAHWCGGDNWRDFIHPVMSSEARNLVAPPLPQPPPAVYYVSDKDYVLANLDLCVRLLQAIPVAREVLNGQ